MNPDIEGQLSASERLLLSRTIKGMPVKPQIIVEVGTWLGGGSTLHILKALRDNGEGHLWGVEAVEEIYDKMIRNIRGAIPDAESLFTPLFGLSREVLPKWLNTLPATSQIDIAFLDGGDNPYEQIEEFKILAPRMKVGGILMSHDARLRKGRWIVPYLSKLDNWKAQLHILSDEGLLLAEKTREQPSKKSLNAAEFHLMIMKLQPVELIGRLLPQQVCAFLLKLMPEHMAKRISQGRR